VIEQPADGETLGVLVREALMQSRIHVPMVNFRDPAQSPTTPLPAAAGVKSYAGYARSVRACFIALDDQRPGFVVQPIRNEPGNGFVDLPEAMLAIDATMTDETLGAGVLRGIALSAGRPPTTWRGRSR
jgi:hypothetical protein